MTYADVLAAALMATLSLCSGHSRVYTWSQVYTLLNSVIVPVCNTLSQEDSQQYACQHLCSLACAQLLATAEPA